MKYIKFQKFYIRSLFKSNQTSINVNAKNTFKIKFNFNLDLTNEEINYEKHLAFGTTNNLNILELCQKINDKDIKVNIHSQDIFYDYKNKNNKNNKIIKREQKIIVVTTELMELILKDPKISDYFIDTTYKIIPKGNKAYKLITISGVENESIKSNLNALVFIKYEDTCSYKMVFKYLNDLYKFNPKVIHIDFAKSLHNALETENLFQNKPIIMHCFFHFVQCIVKYMKKYKICKTKFTKRAFEILKNIEILCFINPNYIKTYSKLLGDYLKEENEKKLYNYLYKNWISKKPELYNYYEIFRIINPNNTVPFFSQLIA